MNVRTMLICGMLLTWSLSGARFAVADEPPICTFEFAIYGPQKEVDRFNNAFTNTGPYKKYGCYTRPLNESPNYPVLKDVSQRNVVVDHYCPIAHEALVRVALASYLEASNTGNQASLPLSDKIILADANGDAEMLSQVFAGASLIVTAGSCAPGCTRGWCMDGYPRCAKDIPTCNLKCN